MEICAASTIDTRLQLQDLDLRLFTNLTSLGPYGPGNREPRFLIEGCAFADLTLVGNRRQHLKGRVTQNGHSAPFIAFRMAKYLEDFEQADSGSLATMCRSVDWILSTPTRSSQRQSVGLLEKEAWPVEFLCSSGIGA